MDVTALPLFIGREQRAALAGIMRLAAEDPVDINMLRWRIMTEDGEAAHRARMMAQSVVIPGAWPFMVAFSIETGHPCGRARHMSMSIDRPGRVPHPEAVWIVARELGFTEPMEHCVSWNEELRDGNFAANLLQPMLS